MTEQDWLAGKDPSPMLSFIREKASDRKLRLFACGCCRRLWDLPDRERREKVDALECLADGVGSEQELILDDDTTEFSRVPGLVLEDWEIP